MNNTQDPKNIPDYLSISTEGWKELSESSRKTLIKSITDDVVATVYLNFKDMFDAYRNIREHLKVVQQVMGVDNPNGCPDFMRDMVDKIDPTNESIYRTLNNHVENLKREKEKTLENLLQTAVNADGKREIIEAILDEIENS